MGHLTWDEVRKFLRDFKRAMNESRLLVWDRSKNNQALIELGLTAKQREELILDLTPSSYCSGPEADDSVTRTGDVWVFGSKHEETEIYVKLKLSPGPPMSAECLSFHRAENALSYPLKE